MTRGQHICYSIRFDDDKRWRVYESIDQMKDYPVFNESFARKKEAKEALMEYDPKVELLTEKEWLALLIRKDDDGKTPPHS